MTSRTKVIATVAALTVEDGEKVKTSTNKTIKYYFLRSLISDKKDSDLFYIIKEWVYITNMCEQKIVTLNITKVIIVETILIMHDSISP